MLANLDEIPAPPDGWEYIDHTFTPDDAKFILERIPKDAHHWRDIERKAPNAVAVYTSLMLQGRWRDETIELGFYEHPIRFDENGGITHGVMRLLACAASGREFRACVLCPIGFLPEVFQWQPS
jgi:hypothetical protein